MTDLAASPVHEVFRRAECQGAFFAESPKRAAVMRAAKSLAVHGAPVRLRVHRNMPFEFIASLLPAFLAFSGHAITCTFSDYDDSLMLAGEGEADVELVWLDFDRYSMTADDLVTWLVSRCQALRSRSRAPILVASSPRRGGAADVLNQRLRDGLGAIPGVRVLPIEDVAAKVGEAYFDARFAAVGATTLSERANVELARAFGLLWLPAVLQPPLKAVVFDLDNTLWGGVLGEDGIDGLMVDGAYSALHEKAAALAEGGMFLGVLSRNEDVDVRAAFASGRIGLPAERIAAWSVSWGSKAEGMQAIAQTLRIGLDAILFVDDNPGELAAVVAACPGIRVLHAKPDPAETLRALELYPGLFSWGRDDAGAVRAADLANNAEREAVRAGAKGEEEYLASLALTVSIAVDPDDQRERLRQLSEKTNQFNLALRRLNDIDVAEILAAPDRFAAGIWLRDRFSDSGLIGAIFARLDGPGRLVVEELCVSCRALGRGIEDAMIAAAVNDLLAAAQADGAAVATVAFSHATGPRNGPARDWLARFTGQALGESGIVEIPWVVREREQMLHTLPIRLERRTGNGSA